MEKANHYCRKYYNNVLSSDQLGIIACNARILKNLNPKIWKNGELDPSC